MAEETENLASLPPPSPTLPQGKGRMSMSDILGFQKPFLERKTALQQEITKAEGDELKAKQAQTELLAEKTMGVEQQAAQQERTAREGYKGAVEKEPLPAFIPTQDNARDLAGMFSLINVMGMLLGGGGKQAAVGALGAMNGMLEGYQKGRADLYKKERELFDKNFKVMQQKHAELRKEMEDAIKLAATDRQAGMAAAQLAAAKAGSSILQAQLRKGQLVGSYKIVEEASAGAKRLEDYKLKREEAEAREAAANERARLQREQQLELEKIRASKRGAGKVLTDKQSREIEGLDSISKGLEQLKKDFKPEFASLGVLGFGADLEFEAKRRLGDEEAQKAISWWSRYERLQAPNRHALFGATLTGNELKNYQSFTAKKSDSPETVKTMLQDQIDYSKSVGDNKKLTFEAAGYQVPEARARNFDESFSGGGGAQYEQEAKSKFGAYEPDKYEYGYEDGKFYRDKK
jgi:hypothetical protein